MTSNKKVFKYLPKQFDEKKAQTIIVKKVND